MPRPASVVTDAELSVLEFLWERGPAVIREMARGLYAANTPSYHATVNSLLDQLVTKGFVARDRTGFAHVFSAKIDRSALVGKQLEHIAASHFGGSLAPMLLTLADKVKLNRRDREVLRKIVESIR